MTMQASPSTESVEARGVPAPAARRDWTNIFFIGACHLLAVAAVLAEVRSQTYTR